MKKRSKIETSATESPGSVPVPSPSARLTRHREKVRVLGFVGPRAADVERFHRIVAGEE